MVEQLLELFRSMPESAFNWIMKMLKNRFLTKSECVSEVKKFPVVMCPEDNQSFENTAKEIADRKIELLTSLHESGALLFRNCNIKSHENFVRILEMLDISPCDNHEYYGEVMRDNLGAVKGVMDVTFSSNSSVIIPHTEAFYWFKQPKYISFFCEETNCRYGETPLFNCVEILRDIPDELLNKLKDKKILMEFRFSSGPSSISSNNSGWQKKNTWQRAFGTEDRSIVEAILNRDDVEFKWEASGSLFVGVHVKLISTHPKTGERCFRGILYPSNNNRNFMIKNYIRPRMGWLHYLNLSLRDLHRNIKMKINRIDARDCLWVARLVGASLSKREKDILTNAYFKNVSIFRWRSDDMILIDNVKVGHARLNVDSTRKIKIYIGRYFDQSEIG